MESEVGRIARCQPRADRAVLSVEAYSTYDELDDAIAEAIADWIESIYPAFFLPEED